MAMAVRAVVITVAAVLLGVGCGGDDNDDGRGDVADSTTTGSSGSPATSGETAPAGPVASSAAGQRCLVRLHGKGGSGADTVTEGDVTVIAPTGNSEGWGGRQWVYFPDDEYATARQIVADSVQGCGQIIVNGFSNGGAFAAALYCRGETFDGRLVGVVVDDPVPDHGVDGCAPDPAVDVTLYWTSALDATAQPGWSCAEGDWTCAGGETIGIDAYAEALGTEIVESPFDDHQWYVDAPELDAWEG